MIDIDPLFVDAQNNNYTLTNTSSCIDSGIDYFDFGNNIIIDIESYNGDAPDMGAYEYITEDCMEEECEAELGDATGDGQINILDLVQISFYILEISTPTYPCASDYTGDGEVNILDLVQIANYILDN